MAQVLVFLQAIQLPSQQTTHFMLSGSRHVLRRFPMQTENKFSLLLNQQFVLTHFQNQRQLLIS